MGVRRRVLENEIMEVERERVEKAELIGQEEEI